MSGTAMRLPVPGPRLDWRMSGRPGSSSFCSAPLTLGNPISANCVLLMRPPRSNTRKMSPGGTVSQAGKGAKLSKMPMARMAALVGTGFLISAGSLAAV